ncbi:NAD(P)/FAD-dependent oxidoreductase [Actinomadura fibrosa]|uniref:NAD(P)/FAD-dependent oxidoreductase n=1 Tax=Actinomadura fibrosa TaxID=111802 RepID=A0ABW2XQC7_9ACTN|nr:FAD-binding protein [Actinomadura fibrosa]
MPNTVIAGAGAAGLATALALGEHGHRVLVVDPSPAPPEGDLPDAADRWDRPSLPHLAQPHTVTSVGALLLRDRVPDLWEDLVAAGALPLDLTAAMPGGGRPTGTDAQLIALACRRPLLDLALYRRARATPGVEIWHGTTVSALALDEGRRRVAGVRTGSGARLAASVVVDATGRRARAARWLAAAGLPVPPDHASSAGVRVYSRFYRRTSDGGPPGPLNRGNAAGFVGDQYAGVLHPADGRHFSVAIGVLPEDHAMGSLLAPAGFTAAARSLPHVSPWLADGAAEATTPVRTMTCQASVLRGLATAQRQPVTGLFPVGDAACVTNPLFGRGVSLALAHGFALAAAIAEHPEGGPEQGRAAVRAARRLLRPWYVQSADDDAERIPRWRAALDGAEPPPEPEADAGRLALRTVGRAAAAGDPVVWRGLTRVLMGLDTPAAVFSDDDFRAHVRKSLAAGGPAAPPPPGRAELLEIAARSR